MCTTYHSPGRIHGLSPGLGFVVVAFDVLTVVGQLGLELVAVDGDHGLDLDLTVLDLVDLDLLDHDVVDHGVVGHGLVHGRSGALVRVAHRSYSQRAAEPNR